MDVIEVLARIVEQRLIFSKSPLDHFLDRFALPLRALHQIVSGVHIGEVVLVVMVFERLARHVGGERVVRIRKIGQGEGHRVPPR